MTNIDRPSSVEQCIADITECSICNEVLEDNRCLPCLHTFCLKCLESYKQGKPTARTLPCPICRRELPTPKCVANLPRNFFVDKLIDAHSRKQLDVAKICEICEGTKVVKATHFCYDCNQNLCLACQGQHKKIKATMKHRVVDSKSVNATHEFSPRPTYCVAHTTKEAEVYCQDCKMFICWRCKHLTHSSHTSIEIICAAKDLTAKLEKQIEQISEHVRNKQDDIRKLAEREKLYTDEIDAESANICRELSRLYRKITENGEKLKNALNMSTAVHLKAIHELRHKLETDVNELKKHKVYIEQMIHLGNVSDLCEYTDKLISETARMMAETNCEIIVPSVAHLSDFDLQNLLIGKKTDIDQQYKHNNNKEQLQDDLNPNNYSKEESSEDELFQKNKNWSLERTISLEDSGAVCGITVLDSKLYTVFQNKSNIRVFDSAKFLFLKDFTVDELVNPNDIASCKFSNCLYICDWNTTRIFRVEIGEGMEPKNNWSIDGDVGCISVTAEHNILLAGYRSNKLKEYTFKGKLIRTISLRDGFKPWHAIRLVSNDILICQGDQSSMFHRVCLIDSNGKVTNSFGGVMGSDEKHLSGPYHLAVDKSGYILVNDCNNGRIVLLSHDLKFIKEIIPSSAIVLRRARRMYLDEVTDRLYVTDNLTTGGETRDGRIQVFSFS